MLISVLVSLVLPWASLMADVIPVYDYNADASDVESLYEIPKSVAVM